MAIFGTFSLNESSQGYILCPDSVLCQKNVETLKNLSEKEGTFQWFSILSNSSLNSGQVMDIKVSCSQMISLFPGQIVAELVLQCVQFSYDLCNWSPCAIRLIQKLRAQRGIYLVSNLYEKDVKYRRPIRENIFFRKIILKKYKTLQP